MRGSPFSRLVLFAIVVCAAFSTRRVGADAWNSAPTIYRLSNGLRVVLAEDHRTPVVGAMLRYDIGSRDDAYGLSILAPRLMLRASKHVRSGEYDRLLTDAGGRSLDWGVSLDATTFSVTVPATQANLPLWL